MHGQQNIKMDKFGSQRFKCNGIPVYCVDKRLVFETLHSEEREIYGVKRSRILLAPSSLYAQTEDTALIIMNVTWAYIFGS